MDTNLILEIVLTLITIMGAILTSLIIPYIKTKTTVAQRDNATFWVDMAMKAAEQIFDIPKSGAEKKAFVIEFLQAKGIALTDEELDVLIESAIKELNIAKEQL